MGEAAARAFRRVTATVGGSDRELALRPEPAAVRGNAVRMRGA